MHVFWSQPNSHLFRLSESAFEASMKLLCGKSSVNPIRQINLPNFEILPPSDQILSKRKQHQFFGQEIVPDWFNSSSFPIGCQPFTPSIKECSLWAQLPPRERLRVASNYGTSGKLQSKERVKVVAVLLEFAHTRILDTIRWILDAISYWSE